jgi:hypothetical protein
MRERPGSGRSQLTALTNNTKPITEFTGKNSNKSYYNSNNQTTMIDKLDKNTKLADFLKNDSSLGRDQQIGVG